MTLLELLVAFAIFVLLIAALVSLATTGLDTWTSGEARKDNYDRAQTILAILSEDLRNAFSENAIFNDGTKDLMSAAFLCDYDGNQNQRLRFVRGGDREVVQVDPATQIRKTTPSMYYGDFWEIAYVMDSDSTKNILYRGIRYFDRRLEYTLLRDEDLVRTSAKFFQDNAIVLERGVLYLGFAFWTQETTTWQPPRTRYFTCDRPTHRPLVQLAAAGKCPLCGKATAERAVEVAEAPSLLWDSTRKTEQGFRYHKKRTDRTNPDFVYPEIVQITLVVESQASEIRGLRLAEPLGDGDQTIRVTETEGLQDPPSLVKIDAEWIEYDGRTFDEIKVKKRGVRGTKAKPHAKGAAVHFGESFVTEVRLAAFREAVLR